MITNYVRASGAEELLRAMRARAASAGTQIQAAAQVILDEVRARGYDAVVEASLRLDGAAPREITKQELEAAAGRIAPALLAALQESACNIRDYQSQLLQKSRVWESPIVGGEVGQIVRGLDRVGVYVPGGTAAYPSSVLMNVVPAKVAGVGEVIMVTPPTENLNDAVLAAAWVAGVDRCFAVGGVQAVAALTYGAGPIEKVDKLVGPGNAYVAAAKRLVYGVVDIDMVAGPSEVLVLADESANARYVAADLLSQAEHDRLASAVLLTTSEQLAEQVMGELAAQTARLSRSEIILESLKNYGAVIVCDDLSQCVRLANEIAPEHLEVVTVSPADILPQLHNAGAVFLGENTPEPLGDYMAGPSHVLPTSGTARFFSPLSAESFLKKMSVINFSRAALLSVASGIITMAESEKLTAHANAIRVRLN
ncbi:MAG: histidinol dehydrogenase [Oscillospiraceae bacterium]|nr:histidinol dehydrogenase [Oscillospiraceae bacterium]